MPLSVCWLYFHELADFVEKTSILYVYMYKYVCLGFGLQFLQNLYSRACETNNICPGKSVRHEITNIEMLLELKDVISNKGDGP